MKNTTASQGLGVFRSPAVERVAELHKSHWLAGDLNDLAAGLWTPAGAGLLHHDRHQAKSRQQRDHDREGEACTA
jgi:hypothetical protein